METEGSNISEAWANAFIEVAKAPGKKITGLTVTVNLSQNEKDWENKAVRDLLEKRIKGVPKLRGKSINTVANTIFPQSIWNRKKPAETYFEKYTSILPMLRRSCPENHNGLYFERMIAFEKDGKPFNQLEFVLKAWKELNRRSAFQVSTFDPRKDHRMMPYLGFPCLQHVTFVPLGSNGKVGLVVCGFYAVQYMFEKAYGNYLGLCRLGTFMAHYMGLKFVRLSCFVSTAEIGDRIRAGEANDISQELQKVLGK